MKMIHTLLTCWLLLGLLACGDRAGVKPTEQTTLFLRNKGADMPIWVRGKAQSNKIILFVHGGPGDCAMCYRYYLQGYVLNYAFNSPNTALAQFTHGRAYGYYGEVESRNFEKGPLLTNIRVPIALFWGVKDGVVPLEVGRATKPLLTNARVTEIDFAESWHEPFVTETDTFTRAVLTFVR